MEINEVMTFKLTIKEQALAHYRRMMLWAGMQKVDYYFPGGIMLDEIGENWFGKFCPYCRSTSCKITECKLGSSGLNCCDGLWNRLNHIKSWNEWINVAQMVYEYIEENG